MKAQASCGEPRCYARSAQVLNELGFLAALVVSKTVLHDAEPLKAIHRSIGVPLLRAKMTTRRTPMTDNGSTMPSQSWDARTVFQNHERSYELEHFPDLVRRFP